MHTEQRTYVGQTGTHAFDGFGGFRRSRQHQLTVTPTGDGQLLVVDANAPASAPTRGARVVITPAEFERWFTA